MTLYPSDRVSRQAMRQRLVEEAVEQARRDAQLAGLSINCEQDTRWSVELKRHRCRNDGSGCLCACHDPTEEGARA